MVCPGQWGKRYPPLLGYNTQVVVTARVRTASRHGLAIALAYLVIDGPDDPATERDDALCDELVSYLQEHPHAMDSLEGIAEWWLPRHHIRIGVERVSRALESLTKRDILERIPKGNRMLYRLRSSVERESTEE
jgi:hypothetical protein